MRKLRNLKRTKAFREIEQKILEASPEEKKPLYVQRRKMLKNAGFSEYAFKDDITPMQKHFVEHIATHIAHRTASNVWRSYEKVLFHEGKAVNFKRKGTLNSIANQKAGTSMSYKNGVFYWNGGKSPNQINLAIKVKEPSTDYEKQMMKKEYKYFRVIRKWMKTRYKYYLQITLKGKPVNKNRATATGRVGIDIGTQSIAFVSSKDVKLLELADKVNKNHTRQCLLQRKMDVSRRVANPDNFRDDGTIKRGVRLKWKYSNRYITLRGQVRELQRKNAAIRLYQHNCLANYILTLGSDVFVEDMNYKGLQNRNKKTEKDASGRFKKKKRFGKSLANKAPATFLSILDGKLKNQYGHGLYKVDKWEYKASQYNHLNQKYNKKTLSERIFQIGNNPIQRDLYSAFLIMNADCTLKKPDKELCDKFYPVFIGLHNKEITRIKNDKKEHLSSFGV